MRQDLMIVSLDQSVDRTHGLYSKHTLFILLCIHSNTVQMRVRSGHGSKICVIHDPTQHIGPWRWPVR